LRYVSANEPSQEDGGVARRLAAFVSLTAYRQLPPQTIDYAKMLAASTVASSALGTQVPTAQMIRAVVRERWGAGQASVWFEGGVRASVPDAVRLNAVRSSAAASDDSDLRNILHAGTAVATAAIAAGERVGASGEVLLAAIVLGYEAAARVGASITPGFRDKGFHGCIAAIFGSAVAAGRLLGLSVEHMTHAIALAATTISGLLRCAEVSNAREHQDSMAAMLGVEAALAARQGFTGDKLVFEGEHGYFEVFGNRSVADATREVCDGYGDSWAIVTALAIKLAPGGHPFHAGAEAAAAAVDSLDITADAISAIEIAAPGLTALRGPLHPRSMLEMAHSQAYFVAAGAADRAFSWQHAGPAKISDPTIHRLIDLVRVGPAPSEAAERYRLGATVTVHTLDGRSAQVTIFEPRGSGALGIPWAAIDAKYRALVPAAGLPPHRIEESLRQIHSLDEISDINDLTSLLAGNTREPELIEEPQSQ
jgi:2-methylcitrate dehydratase PrpD